MRSVPRWPVRSSTIAVCLGLVACAEAGVPAVASASAADSGVAAADPGVAAPDVSSPAPSQDLPAADPGSPPPPTTTLHLESGTFQVPAAQETFACTYTDAVAERDRAIRATQGQQAPYGHHVTLYYTTSPRPQGQGSCDGIMGAELNQIAPAPTGGAYVFASGAAVRWPKGAQLVLHSHYINATLAPIEAHDIVTVTLQEADTIDVFLDNFHFSIDQFELAPQGESSVTGTCELDRELRIVTLFGHMHEHGLHYRLERLDPAGGAPGVLLDVPWTVGGDPPSRSFSVDEPLVLPAGSVLRQTCTWTNESGKAILFPTEMCDTAMTYFPADGPLDCPKVTIVSK